MKKGKEVTVQGKRESLVKGTIGFGPGAHKSSPDITFHSNNWSTCQVDQF